MTWRWAIGPWKAGASAKRALLGLGGPQTELSTATGRSLTLRLLEPSSASFVLTGQGADAALVEELITDVWIWRDGTALLRGRVTSTVDDIDETKHLTTAAVVDYRGVLDRRILYTDRTWTTTEQSQIVWDLLADTQAQPGGDLGLTQGAWPATGVARPSVTFKAGDSVWDSIKKLSQMDNGFDFEIDAGLAANLYWPARGVDNGIVLDYGGVVTGVHRAFDPAQYANAIRQSGADAVTPATLSVADIASRPEGRWDAQYGDTQLTTTDMVAKTATTNLARAAAPMPAYSLTLRSGAWGGPGHVWLGDYVLVVVKSGRLSDVVKARVYELDIRVDANDRESVTVVAGDVRLDPRTVLRGISKRVNVLAKR
jgi:hypothetical protein